MFLINPDMVKLPIGTAGLVALLGYAVVFIGLIALMCVILIEGKISVSSKKKAEAAKPAQAAPAPAATAQPVAPARRSGELRVRKVRTYRLQARQARQ